MKLILLLNFVLLCSACTHTRPGALISEQEKVVEVTEIDPDRQTALTKQNFFQLVQIFDLSPFLYTSRLSIEKNVAPRSHPVLTLNTKFANSPHKLLAQWLHQEFHWWANSHPGNIRKAIIDLKKIYPQVPKTIQETEKLVYLHFIINYLELRSLEKYLGHKEALKVMREMMKEENHYLWVYETVIMQSETVKKVIDANKLMPPGLI